MSIMVWADVLITQSATLVGPTRPSTHFDKAGCNCEKLTETILRPISFDGAYTNLDVMSDGVVSHIDC